MRKVTVFNGKNIHWDEDVEKMDFETFKYTHLNQIHPDHMEELYTLATGKLVSKKKLEEPSKKVDAKAEPESKEEIKAPASKKPSFGKKK
jgi:hypothetical protein